MPVTMLMVSVQQDFEAQLAMEVGASHLAVEAFGPDGRLMAEAELKIRLSLIRRVSTLPLWVEAEPLLVEAGRTVALPHLDRLLAAGAFGVLLPPTQEGLEILLYAASAELPVGCHMRFRKERSADPSLLGEQLVALEDALAAGASLLVLDGAAKEVRQHLEKQADIPIFARPGAARHRFLRLCEAWQGPRTAHTPGPLRVLLDELGRLVREPETEQELPVAVRQALHLEP